MDIAGDPEKRVANILDKYAQLGVVKSGDALARAERDYSEKRFPAEAPRAWRRSLEGSEILNRFVHEMKEVTGVRPCRDRKGIPKR